MTPVYVVMIQGVDVAASLISPEKALEYATAECMLSRIPKPWHFETTEYSLEELQASYAKMQSFRLFRLFRCMVDAGEMVKDGFRFKLAPDFTRGHFFN